MKKTTNFKIESRDELLQSIKRKLMYANKLAPEKVDVVIQKINAGDLELKKIDENLDNYILNKEALKNLNAKELERIQLKKEVIENNMGRFSSDEIYNILSDIPQLIMHLNSELSGNSKLQYKLIKQHVLNQDSALKQLFMILHQFELYWHAIENGEFAIKPFSSPLLVGESGVGKTYMMEQAAEIFGFKLIKIDASRLTMEGYVGLHFGQQIFDAIEDEKDVKNKRIVVFVDEFDKLSSLHNEGASSDYKGDSILNELLPFLDYRANNIRVLKEKGNHRSNHSIDVSKICFIMGGAFSRLRIKKETQKVGFSANNQQQKVSISTDDLLKIYPKEIVSRLGKIIELNGVTEEFLYTILESPNYTHLQYYKWFFKKHDIDWELSTNDKPIIIAKALEKKTGTRGLAVALEEYIESKMQELLKL